MKKLKFNIDMALNVIRVQLVGVAFARYSNAYEQSRLFTSKWALQKPPKVMADSRSIVQRSVGSTATAMTIERRKREDVSRTGHESDFSQWKILVGSSDWKEFSLGKGAEKYRTQNLLDCPSCCGVYELGIVTQCSQSSENSRRLTSCCVTPVYVGKTHNLRTRLQHYGRNGDHLEKQSSNGEVTECRHVPSDRQIGLFSKTFSKGFAIAYRTISVESQEEAERIEEQLLRTYDYGWNKRRNGKRRSDDIDKRLNCGVVPNSKLLLPDKILQYFHQMQLGIKTKLFRLFLSICNLATGANSKTILPRITRTSNCSGICGVSIGNGSVCTTPPVKGTKQCAEHRGMKLS